jgi:hypothetical protein
MLPQASQILGETFGRKWDCHLCGFPNAKAWDRHWIERLLHDRSSPEHAPLIAYSPPRNCDQTDAGRFTPAGFFVLVPIIPIRRFPYKCRAEAVRQRIIADQVRNSNPVIPIANNAGRATPCGALAPLTRTELRRRTFLRKDAEHTEARIVRRSMATFFSF